MKRTRTADTRGSLRGEVGRHPQGRRRELDLVARVPTMRGKPEVALVHVEVEGRARRAMARRLKHRSPVLRIVVYLRGGEPAQD